MSQKRTDPAGNGADSQAKNWVSSTATLYRDKPVRRTKKQVEQLERQIRNGDYISVNLKRVQR